MGRSHYTAKVIGGFVQVLEEEGVFNVKYDADKDGKPDDADKVDGYHLADIQSDAQSRVDSHAATNVPTAHDVDIPSPVVVHDDTTVHTTTSTAYTTIHYITRPSFTIFIEAIDWEFRITGAATAYVRERGFVMMGEYAVDVKSEVSTTSTTTISARTGFRYVFMRGNIPDNMRMEFRTTDAAVPAEVSRERLSLVEGRLVAL